MKTKYLSILILIFILSHAGICQPGSLNSEFGENGIINTSFGKWYNYSRSMTLQADGKILLAGLVNMMDTGNFAMARFTSEGNRDNTFSVDGIVISDFGPYVEDAYSVLTTPDGKIVLTGCGFTGTDYQWDFLIARYNSDGTLDQSFSEDGRVYSNLSANSEFAYAACMQEDGKIVAAGYEYETLDFVLMRFNTDGSLDNTFGTEGKLTTDIDDVINTAYCLTIQPDGRIIAAGSTQYTSLNMDITLVRYNPDGSLDNTFSTDGKVVTSFSEYTDVAKAIALQSDGKILVVGGSDEGTDCYVVLARYNSDGTLDLSFDEDGKVITDISCTSICGNALVIQPDNKIVVAGTADNGTDYDIIVLRYNPDGSLDPTFGAEGIVITDIDDMDNEAVAVALTESGNILVSGNSRPGPSEGSTLFIASYLSGLSLGTIDFSIPDNTLLIYPNPLYDNAVLEYELLSVEFISIALFDSKGTMVQSFFSNELRSAGKHIERLVIDTNIPPGNYVLAITNNSNRRSIQIIKSN